MASFICCPSLWCNTVIILVNFIVLSERHFSCAIPLTFFILDVYSFNHNFCSWSTLVELLIEITRANLAAHAPNDFLILDIEIWHLANYHEALWGRYEFELIEIEIIIITNIILLVSSVPANWANFHTDVVLLVAVFDLFQKLALECCSFVHIRVASGNLVFFKFGWKHVTNITLCSTKWA